MSRSTYSSCDDAGCPTPWQQRVLQRQPPGRVALRGSNGAKMEKGI
jgi:hypothetical protein